MLTRTSEGETREGKLHDNTGNGNAACLKEMTNKTLPEEETLPDTPEGNVWIETSYENSECNSTSTPKNSPENSSEKQVSRWMSVLPLYFSAPIHSILHQRFPCWYSYFPHAISSGYEDYIYPGALCIKCPLKLSIVLNLENRTKLWWELFYIITVNFFIIPSGILPGLLVWCAVSDIPVRYLGCGHWCCVPSK